MESKCLQIKLYRKSQWKHALFLPSNEKEVHFSLSEQHREEKNTEEKQKLKLWLAKQQQQQKNTIPPKKNLKNKTKATKPTTCWGNPKWIPWSFSIDKEETKL